MREGWQDCKHILCIRPDNMGDVLMSSPAFRALKETFRCKITLLTSSAGACIAGFLPEIDDVICCDLPWIKTAEPAPPTGIFPLIDTLRARQFDAAVIFTVYSQNPIASIMIAYLAGIPRRLAWCRENPYGLLTHWAPDGEPYRFIRHQVKRDLDLVAQVGATAKNDRLQVMFDENRWPFIVSKLQAIGLHMDLPWLIIHPGVSEEKRQYPTVHWIAVGRRLISELNYQVIITGTAAERTLAASIRSGIGEHAFSAAGLLGLEELMALIRHAPLLISVNTATIHLAAALETPVIVLYARTNPQHLPWKGVGKALTFPVPEAQQSKNEVIRDVAAWMAHDQEMILPEEVASAAGDILTNKVALPFPELITLNRRK